MKVLIARTHEEAAGVAALHEAHHVVLLEGRNHPTGGFGRPPANPTICYALLHWATPVARFNGIAVAIAGYETGVPDPFQILLADQDEILAELMTNGAEVGVPFGLLPFMLELVPDERDGWAVSDAYSVESAATSPPATVPQEAADVGIADEPNHDPSTDGHPGDGADGLDPDGESAT